MPRSATTTTDITTGIGSAETQEVLDSLLSFQAKNAEAFTRLGEEVLDFTIHRLKKDREQLHETARSRDPATVAALWGSFFAMSTHEYVTEAQRLWTKYLAETADGFTETQARLQDAMTGFVDVARTMPSADT